MAQVGKRRRQEEFEYGDEFAPQPPYKQRRYWTVPLSNYIGPNDPELMDVEPVNRADELAYEHDQMYANLAEMQRNGASKEEILRLERDADQYIADKALALNTPWPVEGLHSSILGYGLKYAKPFAEYMGLIDRGQYVLSGVAGKAEVTPERTPGRGVRAPVMQRKRHASGIVTQPGSRVVRMLTYPVRRMRTGRPPLTYFKRRKLGKRYSHRYD